MWADLCHSVGRPEGLNLPSRKGRRHVRVQVSLPSSVLWAEKRKRAWSGDSPQLPQELGYGMSLGLQLSFPTSLAVSAFFFFSHLKSSLCGERLEVEIKSLLFYKE